MNTTEPLQVGTIVHWSSQAAGTTKHKQGVIIGFIPADKRMDELTFCCRVFEHISTSQDKSGSLISQSDRYLIRVDRVSAKGEQLQPWYYAPRVSAVKVLEQEQ